MMRQLLVGLMTLAIGALVGGCGGGGGAAQEVSDAADVVPDGPAVDAADAPDAELPGEVPAVDVGPDPVLPPECSPKCSYAKGEFCDPADMTCKPIACTPCLRSIECGEGGICLDHTFTGGAKQSLCSNACEEDGDCAAGFACAADLRCVPAALCPTPGCDGEGKLGDPCETKGIHVGCPECGEGLVCAGQVANVTCEFATECVTQGLSALYNPECSEEGACGISFCTGKCDEDGSCPEGFGPAYTGLACYCYPVGTAKAGEACPFETVNQDAAECGAELACIGQRPDDQAEDCEVDEDCQSAYFLASSECVEGKCGLSFCSPQCGKGGVCPDGFAPIDVGGLGCMCGPVPVGNAKPGDPCPMGGIHGDKDHCAPGAFCFGFGGGEDADDCKADKDCPLSIWWGNPTCLDGKCATSFCATYCDDEGECPSGFLAQKDAIGCFCMPVETGDSKLGEACPWGDINAAADYCQEGLMCLAFMATEESDDCGKDADCPASIYPGTPACVDGKCGSSFCSDKCDENGDCAMGYVPASVGTGAAEECYCAPKFVGSGVAGDPCPIGKVNADAPGCVAELLCVGSFSDPEDPDECEAPADCPAEYTGTVACVDGECASTVCAAECDEEGACLEGFEPWGEDGCWCTPVPPPPACADTCEGCCTGEECLPGDAVDACGKDGGACAPCGEGQTCDAGVCTCTPNDHKGCVEEEVYWFDSCDVQGDLVEVCTGGQVCQDGACVCVTEDHKACADGKVYWFDSCDVQGDLVEECTGGQVCQDGACVCVPEDHKGCEGDKVYWYDSCGVHGNLVEECTGGKKCQDGACVCVTEDHKECVDGKVYWFDSCDMQGNLVEECMGGKKCQDGACVCLTHDHKGCPVGIQAVYWYDSCGVMEDMFENCGASDKVCEDGACVLP